MARPNSCAAALWAGLAPLRAPQKTQIEASVAAMASNILKIVALWSDIGVLLRNKAEAGNRSRVSRGNGYGGRNRGGGRGARGVGGARGGVPGAPPAPVAEAPATEAETSEAATGETTTDEAGAAATGSADAVASEAEEPAKAEEPAAEDTAQVAAPAALPPVPPSFDVVRVEPDGSATVAGSAAADAKVSLRVDGAEVAQAQADGQGKFAALFTLAASDVPRLLSLVAILADGTEIAAVETVALAPTKPVAVASAETTVEPPADPPVAPEAPAAVLLTEEGAQVLQPASDVPPEVLANVSVDTITYTPEGAVQLGGRGQGAGF